MQEHNIRKQSITVFYAYHAPTSGTVPNFRSCFAFGGQLPAHSAAACGESFGPVKPIIRVKDDAEAIRVANDTAYGLSAAVYSQNIQRAIAVSDQIESGICHINGPTVADEAQMPFGGVKDSGYGRFGGKAAVDAFTSIRWVTIEGPHQHFPF